jgi:hypothetical protein
MSMIVDRMIGKDGSCVQTEVDGDHVTLSLVVRSSDKAQPIQAVFTPQEAARLGTMLLSAVQAHIEMTACVVYTNGPSGPQKAQLPFKLKGAIADQMDKASNNV